MQHWLLLLNLLPVSAQLPTEMVCSVLGLTSVVHIFCALHLSTNIILTTDRILLSVFGILCFEIFCWFGFCI